MEEKAQLEQRIERERQKLRQLSGALDANATAFCGRLAVLTNPERETELEEESESLRRQAQAVSVQAGIVNRLLRG